MQKIEQGVHNAEHLGSVPELDWYDLQVVRELAVANSFRATAIKLGVAVNTVRARVERLESRLGIIMFIRNHEGISITDDGREVLSAVLEMQSAVAGIKPGKGRNLLVREGQIRICCTEGLGELWLTPRLSNLQERLPNHMIVLHSDAGQRRIPSQDYDLCLGFERPTGLSTVVRRLASLHFIMYASANYIARHGEPRSMNEAERHKLVVQAAPGLLHNAQQLFIGEDTARQVTTAQVSTSFSLFRAIIDGVGVGALPSYVSTLSRQLYPLDLPLQLKFDLWMSYDQSRRKSAPLRAVIDWLDECFAAETNPWFAEKFVHPSAFPESALPPSPRQDAWDDLYVELGRR